jgi:hypothetical protein
MLSPNTSGIPHASQSPCVRRHQQMTLSRKLIVRSCTSTIPPCLRLNRKNTPSGIVENKRLSRIAAPALPQRAAACRRSRRCTLCRRTPRVSAAVPVAPCLRRHFLLLLLLFLLPLRFVQLRRRARVDRIVQPQVVAHDVAALGKMTALTRGA